MGLAANMVVLGKCEQAKDNANAALALFRGGLGVSNAALIYAACSDASRAQAMLDAAHAAAPKNSVLASIITPAIRVHIEKNRGNTAEAVQLLESIRGYDLGDVTGLRNNYVRGVLYLEQRRGN